MSGFKTEAELKRFVLKSSKSKKISELDKKGLIYSPQKCPQCHLWHNRDGTKICVPCENGETPMVWTVKGNVYESKKNFPSMKKRKEGWI